MLNPDRADHQAASGSAIQAAVEATEAIDALPATATIDWCDRAAACLTRLVRSGAALAMISQVDDSGRVLSQEATGVAAGHHGPERVRSLSRTQPQLVRAVTAEEAMLDTVRARAERLSQVGWVPESLSKPSAGVLSAMPGGRNWRTGPVGRLWGEATPADLLVGLIPLGEFEYGRVLLVQIAPTPPAVPTPEDGAVLRALLPVLARRAVLAIGPLRSNPGQWLTSKEQAVLDRLVMGRSVKQIADELGRSGHTIHDHVKSLHRKLNASNRGELISRALGHLGHGSPGRSPLPPSPSGEASIVEPSPSPRPASPVTHSFSRTA